MMNEKKKCADVIQLSSNLGSSSIKRERGSEKNRRDHTKKTPAFLFCFSVTCPPRLPKRQQQHQQHQQQHPIGCFRKRATNKN